MSRKKKQKMSIYLDPAMDEIVADAKAKAEGPPFWTGESRDGWQKTLPYKPAEVKPYQGVVHEVKTYHNHYGDEIIFEADNKTIYGGKVADVSLYGLDLVIDLAGLPSDSKRPFVDSAPPSLAILKDLVKMPEVLRLNWRDYDWPNVGMVFWDQLWELLPPKTLICCVGGHGRTGTCAAALMLASGHWTALDAIKHIKKHYCKDAIETKGQQQYVVDLEAGAYDAPEENS